MNWLVLEAGIVVIAVVNTFIGLIAHDLMPAIMSWLIALYVSLKEHHNA